MEMTWKEKLADWISGGAFSRRIEAVSDECTGLAVEAGYYRDHLLQITHLETPNMAHVGKKAVAIAKRGLGE